MKTRLLRLLPPEPAHGLTLQGLNLGLAGPRVRPVASLRTSLWGLDSPSPLGLAAGFDKDGAAITPLLELGLGFVEVGTITPKPQPGNPKPRVFRAPRQRAVINRYGFNSLGHERVYRRLAKWRAMNPEAILGINLGMNKGETDPLRAYLAGVRLFESLASYLVINLSSPNTAGLRDQQTAGLSDLIKAMQDVRHGTSPLLLKLAPDLDGRQIDQIAKTAADQDLDGLILGNTTLDRPSSLPLAFAQEAGGLSGAPLTAKALRVLQAFSDRLQGRVPLIGVGGIMSGEDAVRRLKAGADLMQIYTGLLYRGPGLIREIYRAMAAAMAVAGVDSPQDLKGSPL